MRKKNVRIAIPIFLLLAGLLYTASGAPARDTLRRLLGAVTRIRIAQPATSATDALQEKLFALEERVRALEEERATLNALLALDERAERFIPAPIYAQIAREGERTLIVGKGKTHGVPRGAVVVSPAGIAIGKVERIDQASSFVVLYKDTRFEITAAVAGEPDLFGLIEGGYGEGMRFTKIPAHKELKAGSTVVTAGFESEVPPGIPIGIVQTVEREQESIFQEALISSPIEPRTLRFVAIVVP